MKKIFTIKENNDSNVFLLDQESGKSFSWPKESLPNDFSFGDEVILSLLSPEEPSEDSVLAKNILNEILNID